MHSDQDRTQLGILFYFYLMRMGISVCTVCMYVVCMQLHRRPEEGSPLSWGQLLVATSVLGTEHRSSVWAISTPSC